MKSNSNPGDSFGNNQHPELHQTNSTSNQLLTTSIIRQPITSSTFDNKTVQNNINYIASATNPSSTQQLPKQVAGPSTAQGTLTAIPLYDPSSDLIKHSASNVVNNNNSINFHNNINVLNNASGNQLPNNLDFDPIDGCTSYYSNNRTNEVLLTLYLPYDLIWFDFLFTPTNGRAEFSVNDKERIPPRKVIFMWEALFTIQWKWSIEMTA